MSIHHISAVLEIDSRSQISMKREAGLDINWKQRTAAMLWPKHSEFVNRLQWRSRASRWFQDHSDLPTFTHRFDLYHYVHKNFIGEAPIDYLEFGVFEGASMAEWLRLNDDPQSRFFGFDSFEGLPEDWGLMKKGFFDVKGDVPSIPDPRVQFVKGWFQDSLPEFLKSYTPQTRLIVHNDSDLYASTLYTLANLDNFLTAGSVLVFDEFGGARDEFRAMMDYLAAFWRKVKPVALTRDGQVAFVFE
jgi:O-methyltransferase